MSRPPRPVTQAEACRVADCIYEEGRAMQARAAEEEQAMAAQPSNATVLVSRLRSLARYHALRATRVRGADARSELHHQYDELCREAADALESIAEEGTQ